MNTRTHTPSRQVAADLADAINRRNAHTAHRAESAVHVLLALVIAIFGVLALLHFGLPCATDGALCSLLALVKAKPGVADDEAAPAVQPQHPDDRLSQALHSSYHQGITDGEYKGYTEGWRKGVFDGGFVGVALGGLLVFCAFNVGWLVGQ
jgi:hypothetical protein